MPGFVSHTLMAEDVYNKLNNKHISLEYMQTYSLGGDLCKYAKCRYDSHHKEQDKFIYYMCDYIKDNNLIDDIECLGVLYGHICHYIMDRTIHPLVRKMARTCTKNKHNHTLIEFYYDNYLLEEVNNIRIEEYVKKKTLQAKMDSKVAKMIDYVYLKTYNTKHVSRYYRFNKLLYRVLNTIYRIVNRDLLFNVVGINKFINRNKDVDLINNNHKVCYKNYLQKECADDLITLYKRCIERTLEYIDKVNKYMKI